MRHVQPSQLAAVAARGARGVLRVAKARVPGMAQQVAPSSESVLLVFAGGRSQAYQALQWLWALERLDDRVRGAGGGVGIVCRDPDVVSMLQARTGLPVRSARTTRALSQELRAPKVRVAFYPNQAALNFQALASPLPAHVHLSHGESEKVSMVSNNLKSYDHVFTAGAAARERIAEHLVAFDQSKCIDVGRPQLDQLSPPPPGFPESERPTVLYAPTWEGDSAAMSYSSALSAGPRIIAELLEQGWRVIYRPHPQLGKRKRAFAKADKEMEHLLQTAGPEHVVDRGSAYGWQLGVADAIIADLSAVAFDAVGMNTPVIVVTPDASGAAVLHGGILDHVPTLDPQRLRVRSALEHAASPEAATRRRALAQRHYGDTAPGAQIERFINASLRVIEEREAALQARDSAYGTRRES
ncbi:hypothetical protein DWQ67_11345 [Galactobacter caseinivorans]|uniref:CDP-glycerol--glycerophosphate glycerophosphotransferase n=1 Tax=Galactobacter caseinivorans TaxID=2676123 RepID=A0A496PGT5_9MICC|nr:hypothetical protein DWQ67_11345 [Galactobacter caseinivorans]